MDRDLILDSVRREALMLAARAFVTAGASDEMRQCCLERAAATADALLASTALFTASMNGRESRAALAGVFVAAWPVIMAELLPSLVLAHGGDARLARAVRQAIEAQPVPA